MSTRAHYVEETGGNCRALRHDLPSGKYFLITDDSGSCLPELGRPAWIGYYDASDEPIGDGIREFTWTSSMATCG